MIRASKVLTLLVAAAALAIAGCGGGGSTSAATTSSGSASASTTSSGSAAATTLNVGVIPIVDVAPLYLGIERGFFKAQNLEVVPHLAQGGAAILPGVISGSYQVGFSNYVSIILATSQGLGIKIISPGVGIAPNKPAGTGGARGKVGYCEVLVPKSSPIHSPQDLAGKTIAVNTLKNIGPVTINAALEHQGVKTAGIHYVEVGFPDMLGALNKNQMQAAWECEPFVTQGIKQGDRPVLNSYGGTDPNTPVAGYVASTSYIAQHADVIKRFTTALQKSFRYATNHPDAVHSAVASYAKVPKALADDIILPAWKQQLNMAALQVVADQTLEDGLIKSKADLSKIVATP